MPSRLIVERLTRRRGAAAGRGDRLRVAPARRQRLQGRHAGDARRLVGRRQPRRARHRAPGPRGLPAAGRRHHHLQQLLDQPPAAGDDRAGRPVGDATPAPRASWRSRRATPSTPRRTWPAGSRRRRTGDLRAEFVDQARVLAAVGVDLMLAEYVGTIADCVTAVEACATAGLPVFLGVRHVTPDGSMQYGERLEDLARGATGPPGGGHPADVQPAGDDLGGAAAAAAGPSPARSAATPTSATARTRTSAPRRASSGTPSTRRATHRRATPSSRGRGRRWAPRSSAAAARPARSTSAPSGRWSRGKRARTTGASARG